MASGEFPINVIYGAQQSQYDYGIPASVTLAQWALESGWGTSQLSTHYHNDFGITAGSNWDGDTIYMTNKNGTDGQTYRVYESSYDSIIDHAKILQAQRYKQYTNEATTVEEYVEGIKKGGYATDPDYVSKIMNLIEQYDLNQYNDYASTNYVQDSDGKPATLPNNNSMGLPLSNNNSSSDEDNELKWWGDLIVMIICVLLVILAVVFLVLAFNGGSVASVAGKAIDKATGGTLKKVSKAVS